MKIQKDFYQIKKSKFRIIFGILFLIFTVFILIIESIESEYIRPYDWLLLAIFALSGLTHIIEGLGYSLAKLFGSAFLLIDEDVINIKKGVFSKEKRLSWSEIKSISYKANNFLFVAADNTMLTLNVSTYEYVFVQQIKEAVNVLATKKGIPIGK